MKSSTLTEKKNHLHFMTQRRHAARVIIIEIDRMFFNFQLSSFMTEKLEGPEGLDSSLLLMKSVQKMAWKWINRLVTDRLQKYIRKCKA